jgi:hypothetical protein
MHPHASPIAVQARYPQAIVPAPAPTRRTEAVR